MKRLSAALRFAALLGWLSGCRDAPTAAGVVSGTIDVDSADRALVEQLLSVAAAKPKEIPVVTDRGARGGIRDALEIDGGRLRHVSLRVRAGSAVVVRSGAAHLEDLALRGELASVSLAGLPRLEKLGITRDGREPGDVAIDLAELPQLRSLSIHGVKRAGGVDLLGLPSLEEVSISFGGLERVPALPRGRLKRLDLRAHAISDLAPLEGLDTLQSLALEHNAIRSLATLPSLPRLETLYLGHNPLAAHGALHLPDLPSLQSVDLRSTPVQVVPEDLAKRSSVKVTLPEGASAKAEFEDTLRRLRAIPREPGVELVERVSAGGGTLRGRRGSCSTSEGTSSRARITCDMTIESVEGVARLELMQTDPAMPFRGGGTPQVRVRLTAEAGQAAVLVRTRYDHVETAKLLASLAGAGPVSPAAAQAARQPGDSFDGWKRAVARPGAPAVVGGEVHVVGSSVAVLLEAVGGPARGVRVEVGPP